MHNIFIAKQGMWSRKEKNKLTQFRKSRTLNGEIKIEMILNSLIRRAG